MEERLSLEKEYELVNRDFFLLESEVEKLNVIGHPETATYEEMINCISALLVSEQAGKKLLVPVHYTGTKEQQELQVGPCYPALAVENETGEDWMVAYTHTDQIGIDDEYGIEKVEVKNILDVAYKEKNVKGLLINPDTQPLILTKGLLELAIEVVEDKKEEYGLS